MRKTLLIYDEKKKATATSQMAGVTKTSVGGKQRRTWTRETSSFVSSEKKKKQQKGKKNPSAPAMFANTDQNPDDERDAEELRECRYKGRMWEPPPF